MDIQVGTIYLLGKRPGRRREALGLLVQVISKYPNEYKCSILNKEECPLWKPDTIVATIDVRYDRLLSAVNQKYFLDTSM